jgi:excisionase family DNA binding protein
MQLITVTEAAERLGVSRSTVERMVTRGEIGAYQLPTGTIRFSDFEVDEFLKNCRIAPQQSQGVAA